MLLWVEKPAPLGDGVVTDSHFAELGYALPIAM